MTDVRNTPIEDEHDLRHDQEVLRASEERLRLSTQSGAGVGVFDYDVVADRGLWSPEVCSLLGLPVGGFTTLAESLARCHPDDRDRVERAIAAAIDPRGSEAFVEEFRIHLADTGEWRWVSSVCQTLFEGAGDSRRALRFMGVVTDITARKVREERHAFLLKLSDALRLLGDPLDVQEVAARLLGEHLRANRVGYAEIDGREYVIRREYARGVKPLVGQGPVGTFGAALRDAYRSGEMVVVNDVRTDPRFTEAERAIMEERQIAAYVGVMLIKGGRLVAAFGANNATPRIWTSIEIELIRDVGERTWEAVERARAETALRVREQRLRLALDASAAGSWTWEASTNEIYWDDCVRAQFGFTPGEPITFEKWISRLHEEDRPRLFDRHSNMLHNRHDDEWNMIFRAVRPDGTEAWIQGLGRSMHDADGRLIRITGISLDITEHRRAEDALCASEHKLRLSLRAARLGTWEYNLNTGAFVADAAGKEIRGCDPDEVIETLGDANRHVHPDDVRKVQRRFEQAVAERGTFEYEYRVLLSSGETRWIASLGIVQPGTSSLFGIVQDVTARKQAELELQDRHGEQERTLRLLLETATQGILSVDAGGFIVMANAATESMFGWGRGELVGQSVEQLLPHAYRERHATHRTAYFGAPQPRPMGIGMDLFGQRKDGSTFPIEISLNHVTTAGGGHAIAFVTDISTRKQAEEALRQSHAELERRTLQLRRLASDLTLAEQHVREELARTLHDGLQQLLFSAGVTLERAVASKASSQVGLLLRARADINEAMEAARTLSVNLFPPMLHIGGLHAALAWLAKRTNEQYRVVVNVTADPEANPATSDVRILLFEAVRELLFNAVKHAHVDRVDVNLKVGPGETIHIHVSDEGVGFDPAVTLHHKNQPQVGLGLFSIHERLAFFGGHLHIQSAPGQGARFSLIMPRGDLPGLATAGVKARRHEADWQERLVYDSADGTSKSLRILIADDHAVARAGIRGLFSERPALQVVGEAANGVEAISQAMALQPDVIVMDVSMPQMNGIEATRKIHDALPQIQIVGLSTHSDEDTERSMREAGAEVYFTKNEGTDRLLDYLLSLAQAKGSARV